MRCPLLFLTMVLCLSLGAGDVKQSRRSMESLQSIWADNAGERYIIRSQNYLTTFQFPGSGAIPDAAEISVQRLIGNPEVIFFGNVTPETTDFGYVYFTFAPKARSMPHITSEPPRTSPPAIEESRGKFSIAINAYGEISATPFDNYGVRSHLIRSGNWAEGQLTGNTLSKPRPLLETLGENMVWRLSAGIEHRKPLSCRDLFDGLQNIADLEKKFGK